MTRIALTHRSLAAALAAAMLPAALGAQGIRVTGVTTGRYVDLRPFVEDSVPVSQLADTNTSLPYRFTTGGFYVRCTQGETVCRYLRTGSAISTFPVTQDLEVTGWGFGEGLSFHTQLRFRQGFGEVKEFWPRSEDRMDALDAYLELDRSFYRARVGRQWLSSGLGFKNFDGGALLLRPFTRLSVQAFGGWGLAQALNEPRTSGEIAQWDEIPANTHTNVFGAEVRYNPWRGAAANAIYMREIRTDRGGIISERLATDARWGTSYGALEGWFTWDLAAANVNEARLRYRAPTWVGFTPIVEARRSRPFFELWTIWGAFSPVPFDEGRAQVAWGSRGGALGADVYGAYRKYHEAEAGLETPALRDDGWRIGANATWRITDALSASGGYNRDIGFGASRTDGSAALRWTGEKLSLGVNGTAFQNIYEFRVGDGRVIGGGLDAAIRLTSEARLAGDFMIYRHRGQDSNPLVTDWSQKRATLRLEWTVGSDPGEGRTGGRDR